MAVLTEAKIRSLLKDKDLKTTKVLEIQKGTIVTPSGKGFLSEHQIKIKYTDHQTNTEKQQNQDAQETEIAPYKYMTVYGGCLDKKPEYMTSLYDNMLVFKDNKRIVLRGKLDSFQSKLLETQVAFHHLKQKTLTNDLQEVLDFVRIILKSEVTGEKIKEFSLLNMNPQELREISHHPETYVGSEFFDVHYSMGEVMVRLNTLRTEIRETELAAYEAYRTTNGATERDDIVLALNRLSSLFWIMMCKVIAGHYKT